MRMSRSHTIVSLLVLIQSDKNCNRKICLWSIPKNFALWLVNKVSLLFGLCRFTSLSSLLMHFSTICTLTYGKAHKRSWASMDVKGNCTTVHYFQKNIVRTSHQITTYPSRPLSARLPKSPIPIKISPNIPLFFHFWEAHIYPCRSPRSRKSIAIACESVLHRVFVTKVRTVLEKLAVCLFALLALSYTTPVLVADLLHQENFLTASLWVNVRVWIVSFARCKIKAGRRGFGWGFLLVVLLLLDSTILAEQLI